MAIDFEQQAHGKLVPTEITLRVDGDHNQFVVGP
jgi:hypothetical protein